MYDTWGNTLHILDANGAEITNNSSLAVQNPFRYRGYYYDSESGLYYLQSRYYDPVTGRFISADGQLSGTDNSVNGYNLYAYCFNDPVNASDSEGEWPSWAKKALAAVAVVAVVAVVAAVTVATAGTGTVAACVAVGAAKGAAVGLAVGAATGAATGAISHRITTGSWSGAGTAALESGASGALSGAILGAITGGLNSSSCFVAGTAILTSAGYVSIENIRAGDNVWAKNPDTGETALKKVVQTFVNETNELVHVYVNSEEIVTTPEHPFYVSNCGWIGAIDLRAGDKLVLVNGECAVVEEIQHEILERPIKVYNFEVEDFHTYYVGSTSVLVHNTCTGSYEITFQSGKNYVGKGGPSRMRFSARTHSVLNNDKVISSVWTPAPDTQSAFVDEYFKMAVRGVNNPNTYNKIWSPGRKIFFDSIS